MSIPHTGHKFILCASSGNAKSLVANIQGALLEVRQNPYGFSILQSPIILDFGRRSRTPGIKGDGSGTIPADGLQQGKCILTRDLENFTDPRPYIVIRQQIRKIRFNIGTDIGFPTQGQNM